MTQDAFESSTRVLQYLGGGLSAGQVGVIVARTGVGKSSLLVHIAIDALLRDQTVLHVTLRNTVDRARAYYDEILRATVGRVSTVHDRTAALLAAERRRMIHSYRDRAFDVSQLRANLDMLRDIANFSPDLVVIDGLDSEQFESHIADLVDLANSLGLRLWCTVRVRREDDNVLSRDLCERCAVGIQLRPDGDTVRLRLHRAGEVTELPVALDPATMLVVGEIEATSEGDVPLPAADCTIYSGGANGAESAFGLAAESYGVHEVNFTFQGHKQARTHGRYELSPRELAAGDVSLVYVSRRLNRTYSEGSLIRKVLQTLWHMVSRSQQVFVVGTIQDDGTVVGGTGWSVELARMWNKDLWVFDQEKTGWFSWSGETWVPGLPRVTSIHFAGTGTRYLSDEGQAAIEELFQRSFGR